MENLWRNLIILGLIVFGALILSPVDFLPDLLPIGLVDDIIYGLIEVGLVMLFGGVNARREERIAALPSPEEDIIERAGR